MGSFCANPVNVLCVRATVSAESSHSGFPGRAAKVERDEVNLDRTTKAGVTRMNETIQPPAPELQEHTWGGPQPQASGWSSKNTLAAVAVAAGIAVVGGGVIYAASQSTGTQRGFGGPPGMNVGGNQNGQTGMQGMRGQQGTGMQGGDGVNGTPLHGSFVVSDGNGGYTTELTQTGMVTEISGGAVTARSADNYAHTYTIGASTGVSGIEVGDVVTIRATESNGTATVSAITEGTGTP